MKVLYDKKWGKGRLGDMYRVLKGGSEGSNTHLCRADIRFFDDLSYFGPLQGLQPIIKIKIRGHE